MTATAPEPSSPAPAPQTTGQPLFKMTWSKRGYIKNGGKLEPHEGRLADLKDMPSPAPNVIGTYAAVADMANRLNDAQTNSGYLDWLYSPDPVDAKPYHPHLTKKADNA
ncbi:hypothetical protein SEA_MUFASA8_79 [Arthrobacter phage Mufasa8]|uniref:Uncharacterized protein n=1 Tax=Arthrobacter phage Mufasa8 TaxID=2656526 RepID=A0A649VMA2_9CAUD|nr:hypothetical protein HYQ08_gp079 [Arthrobacter phage Mufasa8]QGJ93527.1 hypothetical protein SEA_MUFASA8_79 [Arthrobacter phage Mufasa8]